MQITVSDKILSIPPFVSTTWDQISALATHHEGGTTFLLLWLMDGKQLRIPVPSDPALLEVIFGAHAKYLREREAIPPQAPPPATPLVVDQIITIPLPFGAGIEQLESVFQHNSAQKGLPPLPAELLQKLTLLLKTVGGEVLASKPEPHCHCLFCQVMRGLHAEAEEEGEVKDEELRFRTWDVVQEGEFLYTATNPLDANEQYHVYLGAPVACSCGETQCEHMRAVLMSE